jgi:hypothetical protein
VKRGWVDEITCLPGSRRPKHGNVVLGHLVKAVLYHHKCGTPALKRDLEPKDYEPLGVQETSYVA